MSASGWLAMRAHGMRPSTVVSNPMLASDLAVADSDEELR